MSVKGRTFAEHNNTAVKTLTLDPPPQKSMHESRFSLNFLRKFRGSFNNMNLTDLEEMLIQKCAEVIAHKSEYADMRNKIEIQGIKLQSYRTLYREMTKQYQDLRMNYQRLLNDLESENEDILRVITTPTVASKVDCSLREEPQQNANGKRRKVDDSNVMSNQQQPPPQSQKKVLEQQFKQNGSSTIEPQTNDGFVSNVMYNQQQPPPQSQKKVLEQKLNQNGSSTIEPQTNDGFVTNVTEIATHSSPITLGPAQKAGLKTADSVQWSQTPPVTLSQTETELQIVSTTNSATSTTLNVYTNQSNSRTPTVSSLCGPTNDLSNVDASEVTGFTQMGANPSDPLVIPTNQGKSPDGLRISPYVQVKKVTPSSTLVLDSSLEPSTPLHSSTLNPAALAQQINSPNFRKLIPPRPIISVINNHIDSGVGISWTLHNMTEKHARVTSFQIFACQETSTTRTMWQRVCDVKATQLPMTVKLTQFQGEQRYHFTVRAVDEYSRKGQFSSQRTWTYITDMDID